MIIPWIFNMISSRIKSLINDKIIEQKNNTAENCSHNNKIWFTVPFITSVSEKFKSITNSSRAVFLQYKQTQILSKYIKILSPNFQTWIWFLKFHIKIVTPLMWDKLVNNWKRESLNTKTIFQEIFPPIL